MPDEVPEPSLPAADTPNDPAPRSTFSTRVDTPKPSAVPTTPRHAKPTIAPTAEPAEPKRAEPRHAKPRHHATRAPEAGDDGPFNDAEGDGKIMDDLFSTVVPDGVLPMGDQGGKPVLQSGSRTCPADNNHHHGGHHNYRWH
ncbi:hypothetical protein [Streptomyces sp. NPDC005166]